MAWQGRLGRPVRLTHVESVAPHFAGVEDGRMEVRGTRNADEMAMLVVRLVRPVPVTPVVECYVVAVLDDQPNKCAAERGFGPHAGAEFEFTVTDNCRAVIGSSGQQHTGVNERAVGNHHRLPFAGIDHRLNCRRVIRHPVALRAKGSGVEYLRRARVPRCPVITPICGWKHSGADGPRRRGEHSTTRDILFVHRFVLTLTLGVARYMNTENI